MNVVVRQQRMLVWTAIALALFDPAQPIQARTIPPSVLPGLDAQAGRQAVDADQRPWRAVVRVQTELGSQCTGALIGPRLALTAAHCLLSRGTGRLVRPASIHVLTSYSHGAYAGHARAVSVEIGPGFAVGPGGSRTPLSPPDADWALLTLDAPLGTEHRVLPLMRERPAGGTAAMLGGYEQDRAQVIVADVACRIIGVVRIGDAVMLRHTCAGTRGVSGAPLLARTPTGDWGIIGIASLADIGVSGGLAVSANAIAPHLLRSP